MLSAMSPSDPSVNAVLAAAQDRIRATAEAAVVEVANSLLMLMKSAGTYRERGQLAFAQIHILESRELFLSSFATALRERIDEDVARRSENRVAGETDWQSISLVDEGQIEEKISFERIGQLISHRSEAELRELDGYMSSLLRHGWADPQKNPLARRRARLGAAQGDREDHRRARHAEDLRPRDRPGDGQRDAGVLPRDRRAAQAARPEADRPGDAPGRRVLGAPAGACGRRGQPPSRKRARPGRCRGRAASASIPARRRAAGSNSLVGRFDEPPADGIDPESSAQLLERLIRGGMPGSLGVPGAARAPAAAEADAELMNLLRRLNGGATYRGEFDALPRDTGYGGYTGHARRRLRADDAQRRPARRHVRAAAVDRTDAA